MAFLIDSNSSNGTDSDTVTSYHVHGCYALSAKVTPGPDQKLYLEAHCEPTTSTQGEVESHNATYSSEIDSAGLHDIMLKSSCVRPIGVMLRMILDALRSSCCLKTGQSSEKKIVQVGVFNVSELHEAATAAQSPLQYFLKEGNRDIMPSRSHRGNAISQNDNLFFVLDYNEQYSCATYYIPLRLQVQKSVTKPREECVVDQETAYLNQCGNQSSEPSLETTSDISPHVQPSVAPPARLPSDTTMSADEVLIPYAKYTQLERELDGYRRRLQTSEAQNVTLKRTLEKELVRFERMQSCDVDLHRKTNYTEMAQTGLPFASSTSSGTPMDGSARLSMKDDKREVKDASQIISIPARERADEEEQIRALLIHAQELEKENAKLREEVVKWKRRAERNLTRSSVVSTHEQRPSVHARSYASHRASPPVRRTLVSSRPQTPSDRSRHPSVEDRGSRNGSNGRFTNQRHQAPGSVATGRGTPSTSRNLQSAVHSPSMRTASRVRRSPTMPRATASEQPTLWRRSPSPCSVMGTPPTMPQRRTVRVQDEILSTRKPPECSVRIRATPPDRSISRQRRESGHFQSRSPQCEFRKGAAGRLHSSRGTPLYNRNEAHPSTIVRSSRTRGPRYSLLEEDEIGDRLSWGSGEDADADSWCGSRSVNSVMECGSDEWSMFETSRVAHRHVTSTRRREYSANALDQSSTIRGAANETRTRYRSPSFPLPPFR